MSEVPSAQLYIDGQFQDAADGRRFDTRNPFNNEVCGSAARASAADVDLAVQAAHRAFHQGPWPRTSPEHRAKILRQIADGLRSNLSRLVLCEIADAGATRKKAADDLMSVIAFMNQFGDLAEQLELGRRISEQTELQYFPVGVCAAIIPWNFPLKMALWKIAPALATGNTLVLKPSELTPLSADILAGIIDATDLPPGVVNIVHGFGPEAGEALTQHPLVDKITFTGSTETGRRVMSNAAAGLKRVTLECGGKSANIVLDDADPDVAVDGAVYAMFYHSGQCCEAGTRLFLPASRHDELLQALCERIQDLGLGDPAKPKTYLGPLISKEQRDKVLSYIELGQSEGARLVQGGGIPDDPKLQQGWYVQPTVFADVRPDMRIAREEIFGPVLCVFSYRDEEELIAMANDSDYGLAGGIWSGSPERAAALSRRLRTGSVWINDYHLFLADAPFGGFGKSGIGREFGREGLMEYLEIQTLHSGPEENPDRQYRMKSLFPPREKT